MGPDEQLTRRAAATTAGRAYLREAMAIQAVAHRAPDVDSGTLAAHMADAYEPAIESALRYLADLPTDARDDLEGRANIQVAAKLYVVARELRHTAARLGVPPDQIDPATVVLFAAMGTQRVERKAPDA